MAVYFDRCSALLAIEQWGFLNSVPHLLWHGESVYNGHLRNTHTYCRAFSSVVVTTWFYDLGIVWDSNTQSSAYGANALAHCAAVSRFWGVLIYINAPDINNSRLFEMVCLPLYTFHLFLLPNIKCIWKQMYVSLLLRMNDPRKIIE